VKPVAAIIRAAFGGAAAKDHPACSLAEKHELSSASDEGDLVAHPVTARLASTLSRITPQFSGGALTYATWHFIHDPSAATAC
jgi:hypothetical protein